MLFSIAKMKLAAAVVSILTRGTLDMTRSVHNLNPNLVFMYMLMEVFPVYMKQIDKRRTKAEVK